LYRNTVTHSRETVDDFALTVNMPMRNPVGSMRDPWLNYTEDAESSIQLQDVE